MRKGICKILVTGAAGFIGSEFVRQLIASGGSRYDIVVIDKLTYAGDLIRLVHLKRKIRFYKADIADPSKIRPIFKIEKPQIVVNFAAETHVDRSIKEAGPFIETNIKGTQVLIEASLEYKIKRFIHISTDEVYGDITRGSFTEESPLRPNSPYAATKAAADLLIKASIRTYGLPAIIIRPCNNYGPWQYPEKLIPVVFIKALQNKRVPVYKKGENIREWLYVSDCASAILSIVKKGKIGEIYNIGSSQEMKNIDVVRQILSLLGKSEKLIEYVKDRPGHDLRYSLNTHKIKKELGWCAKTKFKEGLEITIKDFIKHKDWYLENKT